LSFFFLPFRRRTKEGEREGKHFAPNLHNTTTHQLLVLQELHVLGVVHLLGEDRGRERVPVGRELAEPRRVRGAAGVKKDDIFLLLLLLFVVLF
jgi:hypothetical protein